VCTHVGTLSASSSHAVAATECSRSSTLAALTAAPPLLPSNPPDEVLDVYAGLAGGIVIGRRGALKPDLTGADVHRWVEGRQRGRVLVRTKGWMLSLLVWKGACC
jgi:hypothetical protein